MYYIINDETKCHFTRTPVVKPKKEFNSLIEAKRECDKINRFNNSPFKLVPYKCRVCGKYHIGKNKQILNDLNQDLMKTITEYKFNYASKTSI